MIEPTPEEDKVAADLVNEALDGFDTVFTPEMLEIVRAMLESELVATKTGRRTLRRCEPEPVVDQSGDVAKPGGKQNARGKASGDK
jgi:hypothetical protein